MKIRPSLYHQFIQRFPHRRICVIGDLMMDRFVRGRVSRISPEAPVPVVRVTEQTDVPGGAGNVIANLVSLGCQVSACGVVGMDDIGHELISRLKNMNVKTDGLFRDQGRQTSLKTRVIAEHQQVVRFDLESSTHISSSIQNQICLWLKDALRQTDAVILSDYGKGMITRHILQSAIHWSNRYHKPICVDPKIENFMSYKKVTCITPNIYEAKTGMHRHKIENQKDVIELGRDILKELKSKTVLITQGEGGMTLFEKNRHTHIPAHSQEVFDVTGAGDTVIAVFSASLASGATYVQASVLSNIAAGIVVRKLGTASVTAKELIKALEDL